MNLIPTNDDLLRIDAEVEKRSREQVQALFSEMNNKQAREKKELDDIMSKVNESLGEKNDAKLDCKIEEAQKKAAAEVTEEANNPYHEPFSGMESEFKQVLSGLNMAK